MKPLILISSTDAEFYLLLSHILDVDGFTSELAGDATEMLELATEQKPQAIILDCQPGSAAGVMICSQLKREAETRDIPVVALVAPGAEGLHIDLLRAGVDDSFVRPVAPAKLLDYLRSKLAASRVPDASGEKRLRYGDIEMSLETYRVRRNGREIHLGPIEFRLLRHLLANPGQVFSRDELIGAAWPPNVYVDSRTVDVHIGRLRKSLRLAAGADVIRTVRSAGYALEDRANR